MANIKSQLKRIKTNEISRQRNKSVKSKLRTEIRKVREAVEAGDADKAVSKGVIHANNAANRKSAVTKAAALV